MNPPVTNDCESFTFGVLCLKSFPKDDKKIEQLQYQWRIQDFPQGGAPTPKIDIIFQFFAENCMKMKEFGPPGGARVPGAPPRSANEYCKNNVANIYKISFCFLNWKRKFSACTYLQVEHNMIMIKRLGPDYLSSMTYLSTQLCKTHIHNNTRKIYNSVQPISSIMT